MHIGSFAYDQFTDAVQSMEVDFMKIDHISGRVVPSSSRVKIRKAKHLNINFMSFILSRDL